MDEKIVETAASRLEGVTERPLSRRHVLMAGAVAVPFVAAVTASPALATERAGQRGPAAGQHTVRVSDFGYDAADSTRFLQAALDSGAHTVIVDKVAHGDWVTRPLFVTKDDQTISFERGVVLRAKVGGFPNVDDALLTVDSRTGVQLIGYGATFAMNKAEYTDGEWRMALNLLSVDRFLVEGLELRDSGGDGIYVGVSAKSGGRRYSRAVTVRNVVCDNHKRNAMSIISVDDLVIEGCAFLNTRGTSPQSGMDFEPNLAVDRLTNIRIRECVFAGNTTTAFQVVPVNLTADSTPISITVTDSVFERSTTDLALFTVNFPGVNDPGGQLKAKNCLFVTGPSSGTVAIWNKSAFGTDITFDQSTWWSWDTTSPFYTSPFYLRNTPDASGADSAPEYGGITWHDGVLVTNLNQPYLGVVELPGTRGVTRLKGDLTVVNPHGVTADLGSNPHGNDLDVRAKSAPVPTTVEVSTRENRVRGGSTQVLTFKRRSSDVSAPCAIAFDLDGTARHRDDYDGLSGQVVIPVGRSTTSLNVRTRRSDDGGERSLTLRIAASPAYVVGAGSEATFVIEQ